MLTTATQSGPAPPYRSGCEWTTVNNWFPRFGLARIFAVYTDAGQRPPHEAPPEAEADLPQEPG